MNDNRPLYSSDAEKSFLGCLIQEPKYIQEANLIINNLEVFFVKQHQIFFDNLVAMNDEQIAINLETIIENLKLNNILKKCGGEVYITEFIDKAPSADTWKIFLDHIMEYFLSREILSFISKIATSIKSSNLDHGIEGVIDNMQASLNDFSKFKTKDNINRIDFFKEKILENFANISTGEIKGINTGFRKIDKILLGLKPGDMFVLGARPSIGKTSCALNIASNIAIKRNPRIPVGIFSLEMTSEQLVQRMICTEAKVSIQDLYNKKGSLEITNNLINAAMNLKDIPIYIDDQPQLTILELKSKARRMKDKYNVSLIIIDYLQLMKDNSRFKQDNREREVANISAGIKALAKELEIVIIVLAQLNRQTEMTKEKRPQLSNLRESGSIEQDADIVMFIDRSKEEELNASDEEKNNGLNASLIIAKNRNGATGKEELEYFPKYTLFKSSISSNTIEKKNTPQ